MAAHSGETHEKALIRAFIQKPRQQRLSELLRNPRKRPDLLAELAHFSWIEPKFAIEIAGDQSYLAAILGLLQKKGAPTSCWVISEDTEIDSRELPLAEVLERTIGYGTGTFLSCIPGKLAYFENEDGRWILERK